MPETETAGYWTRKLDQLGLELPTVVPPVANYVPAVRTGAFVYTSGQLPMVDGALAAQWLQKFREHVENPLRLLV